MKAYTDEKQSKILAEILPIDSADMWYWEFPTAPTYNDYGHPMFHKGEDIRNVPCWSFVALLKYLSEINLQVYTPILFPTEGKWILQFLEYGRGNVWEVSCDNPIDACVKMILNLHKFNLL